MDTKFLGRSVAGIADAGLDCSGSRAGCIVIGPQLAQLSLQRTLYRAGITDPGCSDD